MHTHYLPITKSGWFYLWLSLAALILFANYSNQFKEIELANLNIWSNNNSERLTQSAVVRIIDIEFDQTGFDKVQKLAKKHPNATFGFIGNYSKEFLDQISNRKLKGDPINAVFFSRNHSSVSNIEKRDNQRGIFIHQVENINWKTSIDHRFTLQPKILDNRFYLLWREGDQFYPSFISQLLNESMSQGSKSTININSGLFTANKFLINNHVHRFSYDGSIYISGNLKNTSTFENALETESNLNLILIDDLFFDEGGMIAKALDHLLIDDYLVQNWFSLLLSWVSLLVCSFVVLKIGKVKFRSQVVVVTGTILALIAIQIIFTNLSLWFPIHLTVLFVLLSWIIQLGYWKEQQLFSQRLSGLGGEEKPSKKLKKIKAEKAFGADEQTSSKNSTSQNSSQSEDEVLAQTLVIDKNEAAGTHLTNTLLKVENFGRYQVEGILGKGAMGVVYQGVDPKIHRHVAIKTLQLGDDIDDRSLKENKERFFREAETAGNLSHANIVTIYDVGEQVHANSNSLLGYIAMDLLTGAPLSEYVHEGKLLPPSLVYQLMIQMADALDYAHQKNVIHRDIKPGNIIYDDEIQRGTLTDFGIAYMSDHSKTKTGTIMGSPYYMSPEQVIGKKVDARSDIFSLGVTFYQLLSGHLPFVGESIASVAYHITKSKHKSVSHWNSKLPSSATRISNKAMQKDVNKRYQNMQQFKQALINALKRDFKKLPLS